MSRINRALGFARTVGIRLRAENVPFMSGSIAYQAFVSLAPLLVLALFFLSLVGGDQFGATVVAQLDAATTPDLTPLVRAALRVHPTVGASVIGLVTLLWGAFRVFRGLDTAFSEIYGTQSENTLRDQLIDGAVAVTALLGSLLATSGAAAVVALAAPPYLSFVTSVVLVAGLCLAFFPMYWRFPDTDVTTRETVPGVVVAAVGWTLLQAVFEAYVVLAGRLDAASLFGAVLLLLLWLYLDSLILLVGAVVNAVVKDHPST
jgi:membrane protein